MIAWITSLFSMSETNAIVAGLLGSTIIGGVFYLLKSLPIKLFMFILDSLSLSVLVVQENSPTAYNAFEHELSNKKLWYITGRFHLIYRYLKKTVELTAGENAYFFTILGGKLTMIQKFTDTHVSFWHTYYYRVRFFTRDMTYISNFFSKLYHDQQSLSDGDTIKVFQCIEGGWDYSSKTKTDSPLCMTESKYEICRKIAYFLNNEDKYFERGRPYREGFILSGEPGCGKSYFIYQMASIFDLNIYYVNLESFTSDAMFIKAMLQISHPSIILFEDIDCAKMTAKRNPDKPTVKKTLQSLTDKDENNKDAAPGVSFSTLLNTFDGLLSQDGQLVFVTTNHLDTLDPALVRAGRFNTNVVFDKMTNAEIIQWTNHFFGEKEIFELPYMELSIAELSNICEDSTYKEVVEKLKTFKE